MVWMFPGFLNKRFYINPTLGQLRPPVQIDHRIIPRELIPVLHALCQLLLVMRQSIARIAQATFDDALTSLVPLL
jgi:hypothetical protein